MLEALREWVGRGESQREETLGAMVGLAYNYLEPGMNDQLLEVLTMANALENVIADTLMRGRAEGMREAIAQHFGPPSAALERRIAADERALSDLLDRLTGADGPSDLLAN